MRKLFMALSEVSCVKSCKDAHFQMARLDKYGHTVAEMELEHFKHFGVVVLSVILDE